MVDHEERVRSSIKRAVAILEEISNIPNGSWDVSTYKKALLCRMEVQYSILLLKVLLAKGLNPHRALKSSSGSSVGTHTLKSILEQPLSESTLEGLYQVDQFLGRMILQIRRTIKARKN